MVASSLVARYYVRVKLAWLVVLVVGGVAHADGDAEESSTTVALGHGDRIEKIPTRPKVEELVLVVEPKNPVAVVLLFPGGNGRLGLASGSISAGGDNLMVRTRERFADAGLVAVVLDAPSDHEAGIGDFRTSAEHAKDVGKVVAWASERWHVPVWLVGTSRGTISAANAVARGVMVGGVVLTSSVTAGKKATLHDVAMTKIAVPIVFMHHEQDACNASPMRGARSLAKQLKAPWQTFTGGDPPTGGPCSPLSYHGFLGKDADVVGAIVARIKH